MNRFPRRDDRVAVLVIPAGLEPAACALGTPSDEDPDASAREVSRNSEGAVVAEVGPELRFATSRSSTVAAAETEPLDSIAIALLRAQSAWLRGADRRTLRRTLVALLAQLDD